MKVIKAPPPQKTDEQKISQFRQLFANWKNVKTHTRDMHGAGCGAKIEFEYSDLEHLYYFGMFGGQGHYAAVKCPYCHEYMVVNEKIPKKLWSLLTLEQSGSFGGLEEER